MISLSASLPKKHEESPKLWIRFALTTNLQLNPYGDAPVSELLSLDSVLPNRPDLIKIAVGDVGADGEKPK